MRVSELASVTLDAIKTGKISISCKEKHRQIYLVHKLKWKLLDYCKKKNIKSGVVFITRNGNPVDRSNIWTEMKKVAEKAGVALEKAFPHNLRHRLNRRTRLCREHACRQRKHQLRADSIPAFAAPEMQNRKDPLLCTAFCKAATKRHQFRITLRHVEQCQRIGLFAI